MKKSIKIVACLLAVALFCAIPAKASAKGNHFSFSFNLSALSAFMAPPPPRAPIIERHVMVAPRPCPPPYIHQHTTIVRQYYANPYYVYPAPAPHGYYICPR